MRLTLTSAGHPIPRSQSPKATDGSSGSISVSSQVAPASGVKSLQAQLRPAGVVELEQHVGSGERQLQVQRVDTAHQLELCIASQSGRTAKPLDSFAV
jgi:hypothetical protein